MTRYEGSWLRGTELWIVMEYLSGGSCGDLLKPGVFREEYIAIILRELLKGLEYLHGEGKLHRDIKGMAIRFHRALFSVAADLSHASQRQTFCSALREKVRQPPTFALETGFAVQ